MPLPSPKKGTYYENGLDHVSSVGMIHDRCLNDAARMSSASAHERRLLADLNATIATLGSHSNLGKDVSMETIESALTALLGKDKTNWPQMKNMLRDKWPKPGQPTPIDWEAVEQSFLGPVDE